MIEHKFTGTPFTVGIEEELMLLDADSLDLVSGISELLGAMPSELEGQIKPELFQSVLEVATVPCAGVPEAVAELAKLRQVVVDLAGGFGMKVGAGGTHPFARCDDQLIVEIDRYQELAAELTFIADRELIFGTHVHIGVDSPDKAIYIADGIRRYIPLMLAVSANSPFWEGKRTGMRSARTPVFRAFPRSGVPPHYGSWEIFSGRVGQMIRSGAIDDYTYLWWDVRPHPKIGTVEIRVFDQAGSLDDVGAFAAFSQALAHRFAGAYSAGEPLVEVPWELIDDNKVRAALKGLDSELLDVTVGMHVPARELASRLLGELELSAAELGCSAELDGLGRIIEAGTGADQQLAVADAAGAGLRDVVAATMLLGD